MFVSLLDGLTPASLNALNLPLSLKNSTLLCKKELVSFEVGGRKWGL